MARAHATHDADCRSLVRRYSGALFLLAVTSLLIACGGGGGGDSATETTVTLVWDAVTDPNLSGYRIYYGTASGTYSQPFGQGLDVGNVTTYTVTATGLISGTQYYFAATAYDPSNIESNYSNEISRIIP